MGYEHIRVETGAAAKVILARPAVRNAMSDVTLRELADAFRRLGKEPEVRAVVVGGEGPDFCAGADIEWMRRGGTLPPAAGKKDAGLFADMLFAVSDCPAPVIVAAHGNVFGGGLGLLAAADVGLVVDGAKLCFSETRLGIMPAVISNWVLPKIGAANARRWYLTAELFGAAEAVRMGLAHEALAADALPAKLEALTKALLRNGPNAVRAAKAAIPKLAELPPKKRVAAAIDILVGLRSAPEAQEGLSAFLEKRPASWVPKP